MAFLSPELAEKFAGYIVNRRDKRFITFSVLALYAATLLYHLAGPALGAPVVKAALDSIEMLAAVVVVAHIAGGAAQRAVAQRAVAQRAVAQRAAAERAVPAEPAAAPATGRFVRTTRVLPARHPPGGAR